MILGIIICSCSFVCVYVCGDWKLFSNLLSLTTCSDTESETETNPAKHPQVFAVWLSQIELFGNIKYSLHTTVALVFSFEIMGWLTLQFLNLLHHFHLLSLLDLLDLLHHLHLLDLLELLHLLDLLHHLHLLNLLDLFHHLHLLDPLDLLHLLWWRGCLLRMERCGASASLTISPWPSTPLCSASMLQPQCYSSLLINEDLDLSTWTGPHYTEAGRVIIYKL